MRRIFVALLIFAGFALAHPAAAQESAQAPESAFLQEMFSDEPLKKERFAPSLLEQVPFEQLKAIVDEIKALVGPVVMTQAKGGASYTVVTKTHIVPVQIMLDADNRIGGIFFQSPMKSNMTIEEALAGLGSDAAYLVTRNGEPLQAQRADEALAVGSAFKLGILAVLKDEIDAGPRTWDDVTTLQPHHRSLPTGILQDWPVGAPLTLHTLASLMISLSDNTATDVLLDVAGREAVAKKLGVERVLSTREFFVLKADAPLRARFTEGDADAALADAAKVELPMVAGIHPAHQQGVEWYLPLTTLCGLIGEVGGLDVTQINPGVADRTDWQSVSFKGGSEAGVLNLTTQVVARNGDVYCVAATWNEADGAVAESAKMGAFAGVLKTLAQNP